ncbi:MAG: hypothetical protein KDD64_04255 [Bdellovibrionales bacterium]|nr:hypothetical protein [Bdellovibrionales bacterium]
MNSPRKSLYADAESTITVADRLRAKVLEKVWSVLSLSEDIRGSDTRLLVQAACLDIATVLEEVVELERLNELPTRNQQ